MASSRGYLRFGVAYNPILFSYDGPHQQGLSVDLAAEFEKHLRQTLGKQAKTLTVVLTPLPRESMLDALIEGRVDVLAANLTVTPERARAHFADPTYTGVAEIVVAGPAARPSRELRRPHRDGGARPALEQLFRAPTASNARRRRGKSADPGGRGG